MEHFLLYTPVGSLVIVLVASVVVGFLVWAAVALAVVLAAVALFGLRERLRRYRPGANA